MSTNHVLIVDDEADIRELLVITLMRMGIEATTAQGCKEAITRLKERAYDLCLTDMRLPDGDGMTVLSHIAENYGDTPVAVMTAYGSTDNAVAALKAGAFDYISKPIQLKQLREVITAALNLPQPTTRRAEKASPVVSRNSTPAVHRTTSARAGARTVKFVSCDICAFIAMRSDRASTIQPKGPSPISAASKCSASDEARSRPH